MIYTILVATGELVAFALGHDLRISGVVSDVDVSVRSDMSPTNPRQNMGK